MIRKFCGFGAGKSNKGREKHIFAMGFILVLLSFLLQLAARTVPWFGEWYAVTVYPVLTGSIGRFFGLFPFSTVEILLYAFIFLCLLYGFTHLRYWKKIVNRTFLTAAALFFLYTVNCGINYYRRPFSQFLNYETRQYSVGELEELMDFLTACVNREAEALYKEGREAAGMTPRETAACSVNAMEKLGQEYPPLAGFYPRPKKLLISGILSVQQLAGIYAPFTIEANYNGDMTPYNIPHTACHELSHLRGFMREDEANFIGVLACIGSEDTAFRYSGYLAAWIYAGNALAAEDGSRYANYWDRLGQEVKTDLYENNLFWDRFDTKAAEVSEALNDTYLKANDQTDGVKSYGRAVDLLLAWFHQ